ncbi:hypothetical protein [Ponticoccus alexandrii]|uniref:Uncharacterized protein n=1 Tax=Ponticoccus alexandrii TaxID=1943633 RepID=A0ABX7F6Q4_9RHOB|nr:hypothetical protein [Ponticoccus alexandrii]QRF65378.1 hypothetical protein GQA70_03030 [Ponticoccus alexandrii]
MTRAMRESRARPRRQTDPGVADIARGANGLGEDGGGAVHPMAGLVSASVNGAMAVGLTGAALTLGMMARVMSLGAMVRRGPRDGGVE